MLLAEAAVTTSLMASLVVAGTMTREYLSDAEGTSLVAAGTIGWFWLANCCRNYSLVAGL